MQSRETRPNITVDGHDGCRRLYVTKNRGGDDGVLWLRDAPRRRAEQSPVVRRFCLLEMKWLRRGSHDEMMAGFRREALAKTCNSEGSRRAGGMYEAETPVTCSSQGGESETDPHSREWEGVGERGREGGGRLGAVRGNRTVLFLVVVETGACSCFSRLGLLRGLAKTDGVGVGGQGQRWDGDVDPLFCRIYKARRSEGLISGLVSVTVTQTEAMLSRANAVVFRVYRREAGMVLADCVKACDGSLDPTFGE